MRGRTKITATESISPNNLESRDNTHSPCRSTPAGRNEHYAGLRSRTSNFGRDPLGRKPARGGGNLNQSFNLPALSRRVGISSARVVNYLRGNFETSGASETTDTCSPTRGGGPPLRLAVNLHYPCNERHGKFKLEGMKVKNNDHVNCHGSGTAETTISNYVIRLHCFMHIYPITKKYSSNFLFSVDYKLQRI